MINKINIDGVDHDIVGKDLTKVTYSELKTLRDNGQLIEGHLYRITDYVTTTVQSETKSANHPFDIIVTALSKNTLDEKASAIAHEGDTYFDGNDLGAWQLWYDLDNDKEKYAWADITNGKGVIYRMIDEKRNDCPYDFKNILIYNSIIPDPIAPNRYYYTFSYVVKGKLYDGTVEKQVESCYGNSMGVYKTYNTNTINRNVFRNTSFIRECYYNILGPSCSFNTFGDGCYLNTFNSECSNNRCDNYCSLNKFGHHCTSNIISNECHSNIFGYSCYSNTLGLNCNFNTFGNNCNSNILNVHCEHNIFEYGCYANKLDQHCYDNTFKSTCYYNTLGFYCQSNTFGHYCSAHVLENNCRFKHIDNGETIITFNDKCYDDGSGQLVPIKHPDLSTQPSILPYKFMGQYVYEQLVFLGEYDVENKTISTEIPCQAISVSNPLILRCDGFGYGKYIKGGSQTGTVIRKGITGMPIDLKLTFIQASSSDNIFRVEGSVSGAMTDTGVGIVLGINPIKVYAHIVYTSTPEEGGGYYGYNSY